MVPIFRQFFLWFTFANLCIAYRVSWCDETLNRINLVSCCCCWTTPENIVFAHSQFVDSGKAEVRLLIDTLIGNLSIDCILNAMMTVMAIIQGLQRVWVNMNKFSSYSSHSEKCVFSRFEIFKFYAICVRRSETMLLSILWKLRAAGYGRLSWWWGIGSLGGIGLFPQLSIATQQKIR